MTEPRIPSTASSRCPRHPCLGTVMTTGFCDTCHRRPPAPVAPPPAPPPSPPPPSAPRTAPGPAAPTGTERTPRRTVPAARHAPTGPGGLDRDGLVQLPDIPPPPLEDVVRTKARPPDGSRRCGVEGCDGTIGVAYDGGRAPDHGFCPDCGTPYSLRPQVGPGDLVGEQYRVLGYLSPGGTGWVYLAQDIELPDHRVVLKALINTGDAVARRKAVEERRSLTTLHHRDIVRIITSRSHQAEGDPRPTDYIVMEYVAGRPLNELLRASDQELERVFGEPFGVDHVLTYGCKILGALEYLHLQGLLYCDMKPENVIHYGREIKVIDLGAVREADDRGSGLVYTPDYAPGKRERDERGFHVDTDLYTVGRTLQALAARAAPAAGLAATSFERLIGRATHGDPAARFTSAPQMSRQLWEVLREHRALGRHEQYPERSTRFEPTAVLFGSVLGTIPPPEYWTARTADRPPDLATGAPAPREAARGLPLPIPDPDDAAAVLLGGLATGAPERIAAQVRQDPALNTVETALWLCRAYLRQGAPGWAEAGRWLAEAVRLIGPDTAGYDWRPAWHRGLLGLAQDQVKAAQGEFAAVYATVPGEWAPKLALGYCSEYLGGPERRTEEFYEAVWERDRAQGSAAFGLARAALRRGDKPAAVRVLDRVPPTSRHYDAARIAVVRVLAGRLAGTPPTLDALRQAGERLDDLRLGEARQRLIAEIRENVLAGFPAERPRGRRWARSRQVMDGAPGTGSAAGSAVGSGGAVGSDPGPGGGPGGGRVGSRGRSGGEPGEPVAGPGGAVGAGSAGGPAAGSGPRPDGETGAVTGGPGTFPVLPQGELFEGADSRQRLARLLYESLRDLARRAPDAFERGDLLDRAYAVRPETRF